jgi:hypothetical protein
MSAIRNKFCRWYDAVQETREVLKGLIEKPEEGVLYEVVGVDADVLVLGDAFATKCGISTPVSVTLCPVQSSSLRVGRHKS